MPEGGAGGADPAVAPAPLRGRRVHAGTGAAVSHAARLLRLLGAEVHVDRRADGLSLDDGPPVGAAVWSDAAAEWAASGAMALTGDAGGPPLVAPGEPASVARGAALALEALTTTAEGVRGVQVDGAALLGERAAIAGLSRSGACSPGGSCRLLPTRRGWVAVNLARQSDLELLPAWLEVPVEDDPWGTVAAHLARTESERLVERAAMMGLAVAAVPDAEPQDAQQLARGGGWPPAPWHLAGPLGAEVGAPLVRAPRTPGLVVDLSALWAGPLCAHLLGLAGFTVVKVESPRRPDGARHGPPAFYDLLHGGHRSVALELADPSARDRLRELMAAADVVIDSSRPRALGPLGLGPDELHRRSPRTIWVSITGYGRSGPWRDRAAFGDDAAAAAGLVVRGADGLLRFCADAVADPLAGLHAALGAAALWSADMGGLVDVALREVAGSCVVDPAEVVTRDARRRGGRWFLDTAEGEVVVQPPRARSIEGRAPAMGVDTDEVLASIGA